MQLSCCLDSIEEENGKQAKDRLGVMGEGEKPKDAGTIAALGREMGKDTKDR